MIENEGHSYFVWSLKGSAWRSYPLELTLKIVAIVIGDNSPQVHPNHESHKAHTPNDS